MASLYNDQGWADTLRSEIVTSDKNPVVTLALSICLGWFGADRFYLGSFILGTLKLCTAGGLSVWYAVDLALLVSGRMKDADDCYVASPLKR